MKLRDRGMVKWAPYKSLPEQEFYLKEMELEKLRCERPSLDQQTINKLNETIKLIQKNDSITITYYEDGFIIKENLKFKYFDYVTNEILFKEHSNIKLINILDLEINKD